jgi:hypothetical protein
MRIKSKIINQKSKMTLLGHPERIEGSQAASYGKE